MGKMITTRDIDVTQDDKPKKLKVTTTKNIDVTDLGEDGPLKPGHGPFITTHNVEKFQKKAEKNIEVKKPWNKMNAEERKEHQRMKAAKK